MQFSWIAIAHMVDVLKVIKIGKANIKPKKVIDVKIINFFANEYKKKVHGLFFNIFSQKVFKVSYC